MKSEESKFQTRCVFHLDALTKTTQEEDWKPPRIHRCSLNVRFDVQAVIKLSSIVVAIIRLSATGVRPVMKKKNPLI